MSDFRGKEISNRNYIVNDKNQIAKTIVSTLNGDKTLKEKSVKNQLKKSHVKPRRMTLGLIGKPICCRLVFEFQK